MALEKIRNQRGFTLVEMAIVLVIIGLILGAVIKGKDVMNSARQKKFYTSFIKGWELAVTSYYDRTGQLLADGEANGGGTGGAPDGLADGISGNDLSDDLKKVGLTPVTSNLDGKSGWYQYTGAYSGTQVINMGVTHITSNTDGKTYNALNFVNLPTDLAIALDTIIDGQADSHTGAWRHNNDNGNWPDASTTATVPAFYIINLP